MNARPEASSITKLETVRQYLTPIRGLMDDPHVTEISVNSEHDVWVKRFGREPERFECIYPENKIRAAIQMLASISNRQVGDEGGADVQRARIVSTGIPGFRFEAWMPPVAVRGPSFTCRKVSSKEISLEQYVLDGAMDDACAEYLREAVRVKRNILVAGATGSGKTTLCNALLQLIPVHERLLVIETVPELRIPVPNFVQLEADEEQGYSINRLLVSALRACPERIIIGEVRGAEAAAMLKAANTGHPGSMATLHANGAFDALERLEDMVLEGRPELPLEAIKRRIAGTEPLLVHVAPVKREDGLARPTLVELREVRGFEAGQYLSEVRYAHLSAREVI